MPSVLPPAAAVDPSEAQRSAPWSSEVIVASRNRRRRGFIRVATRATRPFLESQRVPIKVKRKLGDVVTGVTHAPRTTRTEHGNVAGVLGRWARPAGASTDAVILYLHGGGYAAGSSKGFIGFAGLLADRTGVQTFVPDYRLAPENPYPAGLDDTVVTYRGLLNMGFPASRIAVAGESAGAGLALALALRLRDGGEPLPAVLGLECPWLDLAADIAGSRPFRDDPMASPAMGRLWAREYVGDTDPGHPCISPVHADLSGLPPLLIQSSLDDLFEPDATLLAARARQAGLHVEHSAWSGLWHGFQLQAAFLADASAAVDQLAGALREYLCSPLDNDRQGKAK